MLQLHNIHGQRLKWVHYAAPGANNSIGNETVGKWTWNKLHVIKLWIKPLDPKMSFVLSFDYICTAIVPLEKCVSKVHQILIRSTDTKYFGEFFKYVQNRYS